MYNSAYMWNLEKQSQLTYILIINREIDVENKHMHTIRGREGGVNGKIGTDIYTLLCKKQVTAENLLYQHRELNSVLCGDLNKQEIQKEGI